jgi:hypothetical protein
MATAPPGVMMSGKEVRNGRIGRALRRRRDGLSAKLEQKHSRRGGRPRQTSAIHTETDRWVTNALFSSGKSDSADRSKRDRFKDQGRSDQAGADRPTAGHQVVEAVVPVVDAVVRL